MKKKIVVLSGAGLDAESGVATFRDSNGLWENHSVESVASPKGWLMNPGLVLDFYNQRRRQLKEVEPNEAHKQLVRLEEKYDVYHITQNVSDLLERAGCKKILHLHGKLTEAKSSGNDDTVKDIGYEDIKFGDLCEEGFSIRPNIVWFGESVPMMPTAEGLVYDSDIMIIVGTSFSVYPAAGLFGLIKSGNPIYVIDPNDMPILKKENVTYIKNTATIGITELVEQLLAD